VKPKVSKKTTAQKTNQTQISKIFHKPYPSGLDVSQLAIDFLTAHGIEGTHGIDDTQTKRNLD
jgi:hypothetical protein